MRDDLQGLAKDAFWNVFSKGMWLLFWALFGPFSCFFFALGVFFGIVPGLVQATWFVPPIPPPSPEFHAAVSLANLFACIFGIGVILYEFYIPNKEPEGVLDGERLLVVLFTIADIFIISRIAITSGLLTVYLKYWAICAGLSLVLFIYKSVFSIPYEQ